jgi:hypothetical protein
MHSHVHSWDLTLSYTGLSNRSAFNNLDLDVLHLHVANKQVIFFWLSLYILISVEQEAGKQMQALSVKHQAQLIGKGGSRTLLFKVRNY